MTKDFGIIADVAFFYEVGIFIVFNILLWMVIQRRKEKKTDLTDILFKVFLGYDVAILFSAVSKMFNAIWGGVPEVYYDSDALWLIARLHAGRFGFVGVIIGTIYSYELFLRVFKKDMPETQRKLVIGVGIIIIIFLAVVYQFNTDAGGAVQIYELIAFGLILLYMMVVYIPFMKNAFQLARRIPDEEAVYKKGIKSLGYMATSFIMIFFSFVLDRLMLILFNWAYSVFYFLAWAFVLVGTYSAYTGFIKPSVKPKSDA